MKNTLRTFLFRLLFIFIGSSVVCVTLAYIVIENYLSGQIHKQLVSERDFYLKKLPAIHRNPDLAKGEMKEYARSHNALYLRLTSPEESLFLSYASPKLTSELEQSIRGYLQQTPDYAHHIMNVCKSLNKEREATSIPS